MQQKKFTTDAIRFFEERDGKEVAHGYMYIIKNDFHDESYALFEYFSVDEAYRGQGIATELIQAMIDKARELGCYKILMQSRYGRDALHQFYEKMGFHDHGKNFRMNLTQSERKPGAHQADCIGCR